MGATGAVESIASILAINSKKLPPTMHLDQPDPECDLDYVPNEAREILRIDYVMCNTFAFGGTGGVLIFGRI
jgi:3-oxoacyl-[acyl-carrier-protein] synthase II